MVDDALREGLTTSLRTELAGEAERLHDGQVCLDGEHARADTLLLTEDLPAALVEHRIDAADGVLGTLDLDWTKEDQTSEVRRSRQDAVAMAPRTEVDGLLESRLGEQARGVRDTTAGRDDLSSTTVNRIGVELSYNKRSASTRFLEVLRPRGTYRHIEDVHADTTHVLLAQDTLLRRPLERSHTRVLDLVEVLHSLGGIDEDVGAGRVGTEAPDLAGVGDVPAELVGEDPRADLVIVAGVDLARLDRLRELLLDGLRLRVEPVVLVLRL